MGSLGPAANLDGWEAIIGDDADLIAFLGDEETSPPPFIVPRAANDNGPRWISLDGELLARTVWEPRFMTVE